MKTNKKPDKKDLESFGKLEEFFANENKWMIASTALTAAEALGEELMEAFEPYQLSDKARYAIIQYHSMRVLIANILQNKIKSTSEFSIEYMPNINWEDDASWEEKFIFTVKAFYNSLKEQGKI